MWKKRPEGRATLHPHRHRSGGRSLSTTISSTLTRGAEWMDLEGRGGDGTCRTGASVIIIDIDIAAVRARPGCCGGLRGSSSTSHGNHLRLTWKRARRKSVLFSRPQRPAAVPFSLSLARRPARVG